MLILGADPPMVFFPGNAGTKGGLRTRMKSDS